MSYSRKIGDKKRNKKEAKLSPYMGWKPNKSKAVTAGCRCHGSCKYCRDNRLHRINRMRSEYAD